MNAVRSLAVAFVAAISFTVGCASSEVGHKDNEIPVAMKDVPAAVRATLDRESAGGKVTEIEKEVKHGRTVYGADVTINGQEWDIDIAEDGTFLSKEKEKAGE